MKENKGMKVSELHTVLTEQIRGLVTKRIKREEASAVCNAAGKMLSLFRLQMEYAHRVGVKPNISAIVE